MSIGFPHFPQITAHLTQYTRTHARTHAHKHTPTFTHARTYMHTLKHTQTHARTHTYTHTDIHAHTRTLKHTQTHARTHARTHTYIHIHTHAHKNAHILAFLIITGGSCFQFEIFRFVCSERIREYHVYFQRGERGYCPHSLRVSQNNKELLLTRRSGNLTSVFTFTP